MAGPRYSHRSGDCMVYGMYLVFDADGGARMTRSAPDLARNERAVSLEVRLPLALFRALSLRATLTVDAPDQRASIDVTAAQDALRGALGVDIDLQIREAE